MRMWESTAPRCPFPELCGSNDQLWVDATAGMAGMATAHPKGRAKAENEGDVATSSAFPHAGDAASSSSSGSQWVKSVHRTVGVFAEDSETSSMSDVQRRVAREHAAGTCNPCIFLASRQGCRFGEHCRFCHGVHPNRSLPAENTHKKNRNNFSWLLEAYVDDPIGGWRSVLENQSKCMCHNGCIRCIGEALVPSKPSRPQDWQNFFITLPENTVGNG